ncbi:hypothetical protein TNCV_2465051 [Trichonephila clavipes]|uniref:Uncharacterized protein n=1 Tax=Trichonephila clavipes TaxID=2585209 RepID=A0A8X6RDI7_TRICX|nr:hypothetical protein TNCV_2465051 [Trichonephila clavipes]
MPITRAMDEQLKVLLEGINALKNGQEETRQEMQKCLVDTKNELKDRIEKGEEQTKQEMQKGLEDMQKGQERMQKCQEDLKNTLEKKIDNVEEKINSVEEKIALKVEEKIAVVEETIEKKVEQVEERIREQVEEKYEVAGNFSLISQQVEDLEKKLLVSGNKNESKILPFSPVPVPSSPVPVTASTVSVKLSTYDGKTNWEVYKTQFSIISEANGWTEGVKACQLAASLRGEAAKILQTLPDTESG